MVMVHRVVRDACLQVMLMVSAMGGTDWSDVASAAKGLLAEQGHAGYDAEVDLFVADARRNMGE